MAMNKREQAEMAKKTLKPIYKCSDDSEHATPEAAEKHEALLAQEYLAWCFWSSLLSSVACVAGLGVMYRVLKWSIPKADITNLDCGPVGLMACVFSAIACIPLSVFAVAGVHDAVKVKVAPRVVLLEKISELAKGK